jgi:hypothetical protein
MGRCDCAVAGRLLMLIDVMRLCSVPGERTFCEAMCIDAHAVYFDCPPTVEGFMAVYEKLKAEK